MASSIRSVCVYCGSGLGNNPAFAEAARDFGRIMAKDGVRLVYGGGGNGLMGEVARSALAHGGAVTGVITTFLKQREMALESCTELIEALDMHARKLAMFERADAFVALPGGLGTLEELAEQLTWAQIGRHAKPILIADVQGFWKPVLALFAHMREAGFIRPGFEVRVQVAEKIADILPMLRASAHRA